MALLIGATIQNRSYSPHRMKHKPDVTNLIRRSQLMARDRIEPCESYICKGQCKKGREADHNGYCQKCGKYKPRIRKKHINKKKQALEKIRKNERY